MQKNTNNVRRIAVSAAKQGCNVRTSAAVPMMMMNVRINKVNVTTMTAILRIMMMREIRYDKRPYTNTSLTKGKINMAIFTLTTAFDCVGCY